jgi:hypothetical protein
MKAIKLTLLASLLLASTWIAEANAYSDPNACYTNLLPETVAAESNSTYTLTNNAGAQVNVALYNRQGKRIKMPEIQFPSTTEKNPVGSGTHEVQHFWNKTTWNNGQSMAIPSNAVTISVQSYCPLVLTKASLLTSTTLSTTLSASKTINHNASNDSWSLD